MFQGDFFVTADNFIWLFLYEARLSSVADDAYGDIVFPGFQYAGGYAVDAGWVLIAGGSDEYSVYIYGVGIDDAAQAQGGFFACK